MSTKPKPIDEQEAEVLARECFDNALPKTASFIAHNCTSTEAAWRLYHAGFMAGGLKASERALEMFEAGCLGDLKG